MVCLPVAMVYLPVTMVGVYLEQTVKNAQQWEW
jgi:hypothetical protein